ncbi:hypothetical protein [Demequina aurantiaca]|uniref:hypothetical protein n=1 Tax=Demequina aurantiaca TaxID=676200 RepID=UPI003D35538E
MALDLSNYNFPFSVEDLPGVDRAILAMVVNGNDAQLAAIAGTDAAKYADEVNTFAHVFQRLDIAEPAVPFADSLERARFLAHNATDELSIAFPGLNAEVLRRAGNRYAFLNR